MTATENRAPDPGLEAAVDPKSGSTPPGIATGYEGSLGDQVKAYFSRLRAGETGMLPAIAADGQIFYIWAKTYLTFTKIQQFAKTH